MRIIYTIFLSLFVLSSFSQNFHRCGTVEAVNWRNAQAPGYSEAVNATYEQVKHLITEKAASEPTPIYQIPVVVHVVYNTPEENISSNEIYSQIERLNKDYRRLNEDTADTRAEFQPVAADAGIEFYLASLDPDGNPTDGITRTQTNRADFAPDLFGGGSLDEMKQSSLGGVDAWDTDNYLNIWVCDLLGDASLFQVLGFAYPPAIAPNWPANSGATDPAFEGVVVHYQVFGDDTPLATGPLSVADKGRTAVHEVGHFLGLRHIWGDVLFGDGCTEDDGLDDTPNAASNAGQICNFSNNTCTDSPIDYPDMIENYMDYAEERCMNMFTQDQVDIMRSMLEIARTDLPEAAMEPSNVNDFIDPNSITVYPNPSEGEFQIRFPSKLTIKRLSVFDSKGSVVSEMVTNGAAKTNLDLDLIPGAYVAQLQFGEGFVHKKLIVH